MNKQSKKVELGVITQLITQLVLLRKDVGETEDCLLLQQFFKLALLTVFGGIKDSLYSGSTLSSISAALCAMFCAVDSASFFVSALALCVSLIRSLRNLMDTSSVTLRASLVGTDSRTCRSLGTMWFFMYLV